MNDNSKSNDDRLPPPVPIFIDAMALSTDKMDKEETKKQKKIEKLAFEAISSIICQISSEDNSQSTKNKGTINYIELTNQREPSSKRTRYTMPVILYHDMQKKPFNMTRQTVAHFGGCYNKEIDNIKAFKPGRVSRTNFLGYFVLTTR
jgi:hypothetical protein